MQPCPSTRHRQVFHAAVLSRRPTLAGPFRPARLRSAGPCNCHPGGRPRTGDMICRVGNARLDCRVNNFYAIQTWSVVQYAVQWTSTLLRSIDRSCSAQHGCYYIVTAYQPPRLHSHFVVSYAVACLVCTVALYGRPAGRCVMLAKYATNSRGSERLSKPLYVLISKVTWIGIRCVLRCFPFLDMPPIPSQAHA